MFIYICQALPHFQFMKKLYNWYSEKVYLVVCSFLLIVFGGLWSFAGNLSVFAAMTKKYSEKKWPIVYIYLYIWGDILLHNRILRNITVFEFLLWWMRTYSKVYQGFVTSWAYLHSGLIQCADSTRMFLLF